MFLISLLVIWFLITGFLQSKLAEKLEYKNPKEAFVPFLSLRQICKMTGKNFKITEIFKAASYLSELFGERKFFGILVLSPFLNILALNHLLKNRKYFIRDEYGRQIVEEILKGMEQEVDIEEIRQIALSQGVEPTLFDKSFMQTKMLKKVAGRVTEDEINLLPKNFIMTLALLGFGIFIGILFLISRPYMSGVSKNPKNITQEKKKIISVEVEEENFENSENSESKMLELEESLHYSAPIESEFIMEIDTTVLDPNLKGTGLGGLITDGIIQAGETVKILSESKEVIATSIITEMSIYRRGKGKQKLQMAQTGQDISVVIEKVLTNSEKQRAYFLVK